MPKKKTFESALTELQAIIVELESGSPTLEKMMLLFEEGMQLMKDCREELNTVESRITSLIKENEEFIEKPGIGES